MFLDANVFIHAYESKGPKFDASRRLLGRINCGEMRAKTSVLVLNEVLHFFSSNYNLESGVKVFSNIRKTPNLEILGVESKDLELVVEFVKQGLDTSDAYHAAVMRANGLDTICSYDKGFDRIKSIRRQEPD